MVAAVKTASVALLHFLIISRRHPIAVSDVRPTVFHSPANDSPDRSLRLPLNPINPVNLVKNSGRFSKKFFKKAHIDVSGPKILV
jgi:hypothetical protein